MNGISSASCSSWITFLRRRKSGVPSLVLISILLALSFQPSSPLVAQEKMLPVFHFKVLGGSWGNVNARVVRDSLGFVWIGTGGPLLRYDGYGFKEYSNLPNDPRAPTPTRIYSLLVDSKGRLWVGTFDSGLWLYDSFHDRFKHIYPDQDDSSSHEVRTVFRIIEDHSGNLWLAMSSPDGLVRVELPAEGGSNDLDSLARSHHVRSFPLGTPRCTAYDVSEGTDGRILAASDRGLIILDPATAALSRPHLPGPLGRLLDTVLVRTLLQGSTGTLWLGTATEGVVRVDGGRGQAVNYRHREGDSLSITIDDIWDIAEDLRGNLWIGSVKGVDLFSPETGKRIPYMTFDERPEGNRRIQLSYDRTGTFWISTSRVVHRLSPRSQLFPHFAFWDRSGFRKGTHPPPWLGSVQNIERGPDGKLWGISDGTLREIDLVTRTIRKAIDFGVRKKPSEYVTFGPTSSTLDRKGNIWYAAWDLGLYRINPITGAVNSYTYETLLGKTTTVCSIAQGSGDTLWTGGFEQGVFKFDPASGRFLETGIRHGYSVMKDHEGRIWATGALGLNILDPLTGRIERYCNVPSDSHSLSQTLTSSTYEDSFHRIWVGAGNAINLWDPATRSFMRYPNPEFKGGGATPIGCDGRGRLWIRYDDAARLSILDPSSGTFTNFDYDDGLCSHVFSMMNLENGRVLLSGRAGINIVSEDSVDPDRTPPPLVITRMTINDEPTVLPRLVAGSGSLRLSHTQDVLEFEFAAIDIEARGPAEYRYQLEGIERDWTRPTDRRYVRYAGVPPGEYILRARAASVWGRWPGQDIALAITIMPPWWRTIWAYGAYALFLAGLLSAAYRVRLRQVHLQQEVKMEHFHIEHLAEVDRLKSRFFANISHEFRTPLTLILGPIRKWGDRTRDEGEKKDLQMAERNAHRLLRLIDQLLDLSKLEAGAMKLHAGRMNIVPLVKGLAYSFESSAGLRGLTLNVFVDEEEIEVYCDKDMVEKILSNLLSNAFKFSPEGGEVTVSVSPRRVPTDLPTPRVVDESSTVPSPMGRGASEGRCEGSVDISVSDTGVGIPSGELDRVFDRFYQVDASQTREHEGSGIGLALVKELVELHHGTIQVRSEVGRGSTFTVRLPLGRSHLKDEEIVAQEPGFPPLRAITTRRESEAISPVEEIPTAHEDMRRNESGTIILIVEDNADVRAYIRDYLIPGYQVAEARDGAEGIEKALEIIPNLIISDVMMPKKDGYELCRALKTNEKTSHIPIILLTARAAGEDKIEGLEIGADDYLIKPFEPKELLARIRNLIELRRRLRERFNVAVPLKPGEVAVTSLDDVFLHKVMAAAEQHMGDEDFHIEGLATEVGMSRMQLHRKLTALTGQSPGEFIRYLRLHRAIELLQKGVGTVSEIAYSVGFSDPSNFSKCFHKQFGKPPSDVKRASTRAETTG